MVAQLTVNQLVVGSNPTPGAMLKKIPNIRYFLVYAIDRSIALCYAFLIEF